MSPNSSLLADDIALRNLMAKYTDAVNRHDADDWISCWTEDADWDLIVAQASGKTNILALWQQMMSSFEFALMVPSSCLFQLDGDSASGHWYLQEFTRDRQGNSMHIISRYNDRYRRTDGQWYFQSRHYQFLYHGDDELKGQYTPAS